MRVCFLLLILSLLTLAHASDWRLVPGRIMSRWAAKVDPARPWPEYPRPQMVRKDWMNLNGLWMLRIDGGPKGSEFEGKILVPFPIESALSGVRRRVQPHETATYARTFTVPKAWSGKKVLLHFGAVEHTCKVYVDAYEVGGHKGGYTAFSFDITPYLRPGEKQQLTVEVKDLTGDFQPGGKQHAKPEGIWYEPTTGIWQTVWLEPVPEGAIERLELTSDLPGKRLRGVAHGEGEDATWTVRAAGKVVATAVGNKVEIPITSPRLWSPEDPFLYDIEVRRGSDVVTSYVGMRSVEVKPDAQGIQRLFLNGQPYFMNGLLDQGYWPDGNLTAPTDAALKYDLDVTKRFGYNMVRKHVKVEPMRWYYHCDRLGLLVWQDMPSPIITSPLSEEPATRERQKVQFRQELSEMIAQLSSVTSIVMWIPFNEGWGQHDTKETTAYVRSLDPTRLVNNASGWTDAGVGDVLDIHVYPGPGMPPLEPTRAAVLGEFGGLGLPAPGHMWDTEFWGYRKLESKEELERRFIDLYRKLYELKAKGLSAAVYTQTTDVELECNGLMSYDREVLKLDPRRVKAAIKGELPPLPPPNWILETAEGTSAGWKVATEAQGNDWFKEGFDDRGWTVAEGGFGTHGTPGAIVGHVWDSSAIYLRREFTLRKEDLKGLRLRLHHDEDVEVYVNGTLVLKLDGYTTEYEEHALSAEAMKAFRAGKNLLAVHCRQTRGGQYIDVGLVRPGPGAKP